ncbi:arylsulfatase [Pedobacter gandavensis]|uniref:sulfatase family protein n=1 Tax=Pedobacter gandavensis TaxID=2679963 RepID=UPI00292D02B4|nr:arylsulfatase [Pedobacter gandavensis]
MIRFLNAKIICLLMVLTPGLVLAQKRESKPNVIFIYADDLGYGDVGAYGATKIKTANLDRLSGSGIRFTNAHSSSATCTPSRYALMTGNYPWRVKGTDILSGDAALIIPLDRITLPKLFKNAGYNTAIVGKWHLGLGEGVKKDWSNRVSPGPNETGFDYSFIFPATADRVPTVFMENQRVVALDLNDPIEVDYRNKVGNDPTGKDNPELLKMKASPDHGHDNTIVNGIGRIGFMSGGHSARWVDEEISTTFLTTAKNYMRENADRPFFLYLPLTEPHVPRMPATMFKGKSGLGYRGDAILQLDWTVGQILDEVEALGIKENTIIVFSSDNGPVLNDGYQDGAVTQRNGHLPAGVLRGTKGSVFEAGTRVPFMISGPNIAKGKVSDALIGQIDLLASFSKLLKQNVPVGEAKDSQDLWSTLIGATKTGREIYVEHSECLALVKGNWKYIEPNDGVPYRKSTDTETGNSPEPQLYNLRDDIGEKNNLAKKFPDKLKELQKLLQLEKDKK